MRQALGGYDDDVAGGRSDAFALVGEQREDDGYDAPPDRRFSSIVVSMLVMALFAGGLWFAYHLGNRHSAAAGAGAADSGGVPLIRADRQPDKIKPAQPGGMKIPDQNVSIYDETPGSAPVEKLLPPPEKPLPRPEPLPPQQQAPSPAAAAMPTVAERPPAPVVAPRPPEAAGEGAAPGRAAHSALLPGTAGAKGAIAAPRFGNRGTIHVRLASVRTPEAARSEWERLKHENADLLGRLSAVAVRTDLGDLGIYYRIEAGPFGDAAAAERLCAELKRRDLGCILAR
jgi:hypothetical protein